MTGIATLDTGPRPYPAVIDGLQPDGVARRREPIPPGVTGGFSPSWRWTSLLLAPLEFIVVAWTIPLAIFLIMVPVGLALASLLWLGEVIVGR
jgi:hypothetical protein